MRNANTYIILLGVVCILHLTNCLTDDKKIKFARIESCPGCSLNRLIEVKKFIYDDVPHYKHVEFKKIQGAKPELVLLDKNDEEIERIKLSSLSRQECNDLLISKGFVKKGTETDKHEF